MRDNGPRSNFRIRRSRFYLLIIFFSCLPFLCLLLAIQCYVLWEDNQKLRLGVERFEADYQAAEARAERLENLEALLREEDVPGREILVRQLAKADQPQDVDENPPQEPAENAHGAEAEGPGHEEFPVVNTGRVKVSNVQVRAIRGNALRIGLDLRNPDSEQLLSGLVDAVLITANGEKRELSFTPRDVGNFRINRFKRTVMMAQVPRGISLVNARIILEVRSQSGEVIYSNIFAVQR